MIKKAKRGEKLPVYGSGENIRDWIHVSDHCSAIDLVLHQGKTGEVYNIGGKNEMRNIEIVKIILNLLLFGYLCYIFLSSCVYFYKVITCR